MELYFNFNEVFYNNFQDLKIKVEQKIGKDFDCVIVEEFFGIFIVIGMCISLLFCEDNNLLCKWYYWYNYLWLKDFMLGDNFSVIDVVFKKWGWDFKIFVEKVKVIWGINFWECMVIIWIVEFVQCKFKKYVNIQVLIIEQKNVGWSKVRVKIYFRKDVWLMDDEVFWRNFNLFLF